MRWEAPACGSPARGPQACGSSTTGASSRPSKTTSANKVRCQGCARTATSANHHGLCIRPHPRRILSTGPNSANAILQRQPRTCEQLPERGPGCIQGHFQQPVGSPSRRLPGHRQEAGKGSQRAFVTRALLTRSLAAGRAILRWRKQASNSRHLHPHKAHAQYLHNRRPFFCHARFRVHRLYLQSPRRQRPRCAP